MTVAGEGPERILVIKLGALGDFTLALGPMMAIRAHHLSAHITLLTAAPFAEMGHACGWFDEVWIDDRPRAFQLGKWLGLRRRLRQGAFCRVYDLQTSDRTNLYFRLLAPGRRPEWSGTARGCSHPHDNPHRVRMHVLESQAEQLAVCGITLVPAPDLSWMHADISRFPLGRRFALLVPGGSAHRPEKRWPVERYGQLARRFEDAGIRPLLIGAAAEQRLNAGIAHSCPEALDLTDQTSFAEVVELARRADVAVGNDSGVMHLAATACPCVVLFSAASDPARCAPRGAAVTVLKRLGDLGVDEVAAAAGLDGGPGGPGTSET